MWKTKPQFVFKQSNNWRKGTSRESDVCLKWWSGRSLVFSIGWLRSKLKRRWVTFGDGWPRLARRSCMKATSCQCHPQKNLTTSSLEVQDKPCGWQGMHLQLTRNIENSYLPLKRGHTSVQSSLYYHDYAKRFYLQQVGRFLQSWAAAWTKLKRYKWPYPQNESTDVTNRIFQHFSLHSMSL